MRYVILLTMLAGACDRGPRTATILLPNSPAPAKEGLIELTKFADKVVVTNHSKQPATECIVIIDDAIRGDLGALAPRATVTVMRSRFTPYTEAEVFYARAKVRTRMECLTPDEGRVVVHFQGGPEYTVPAEALNRR